MAMCKVSSVQFVRRSTVTLREGGTGNSWTPNTDVYATDSGLVIKVELAGVRSDHLEITVEGNRLRISGNRPDGCRAPKCNFLVMEISYGSFETTLEIPSEYDLSHAKAAYLNGFLRIDVPIGEKKLQKTKVSVAEGSAVPV
jgi:HSP20 family protein